jgi:hypothetical protein
VCGRPSAYGFSAPCSRSPTRYRAALQRIRDASRSPSPPRAILAGMNRPQPIPLRPDPRALELDQRRSLIRAATAVALGAVSHRSATDVLARAWPNDTGAELVLRAAVAPTLMANAAAISVDAVAFLVSMAPTSAAARLFEKALRINLQGIHATNIARLVTVPAPGFVAEGAPIPVVQGDFDTTPVGPVFKLAFIVGLSNELEFSTAENAAVIVARALADAASKQFDGVVFDNVSGDSTRPDGLLNGVAAIPGTAGGGVNAMAGDLAALAGALTDASSTRRTWSSSSIHGKRSNCVCWPGPGFRTPSLAPARSRAAALSASRRPALHRGLTVSRKSKVRPRAPFISIVRRPPSARPARRPSWPRRREVPGRPTRGCSRFG